MDTLRGQFDPADFSDDLSDFDIAEDVGGHEPPPSPIGQDERRMQVRAYNHWAGLLGNRNYPAIGDLRPEDLPDFGPYSVLLEFTDGIEDPSIRFLGDELAAECGAEGTYQRLSDVPARSLLSRITDHYLQILANQAPIGFEAEFVNQRAITILYRGILLPYSSDNETIDFIYGVINWKEMADQQTTDELMLEVDQALELVEIPRSGYEEEEDSNILDLGSFGDDTDDFDAEEPVKERMPRPSFGSLLTPEGFDDEDDEDEDEESYLPAGWSLSDPNTIDDDAEYADDSADVYDDDYDPDAEDDDIELGLTRIVEVEFERSGRQPITISELDIEGDPIEPELSGADAHELAREEFSPGYAPLDLTTEEPADLDAEAESTALPAQPDYSEEFVTEEIASSELTSNEDEGLDAAAVPAIAEATVDFSGDFDDFDENAADDELELVEEVSPDEDPEEYGLGEDIVELENEVATAEIHEPAPTFQPLEPEQVLAPKEIEEIAVALEPAADAGDGLYDCLADARELAHTASSAEDRSRTALYAAVGRAYDVSLAAIEAPADYDELLEENGLTVQDRAPMTPIVKLVFGADYDKTRITEYASALTHAHRMGIGRGKLGTYLTAFDGGLKGVVNAERRLRREEAGQPVVGHDEVRASLAKRLRAIEGTDLADISVDGAEFALVMIRRTDDGDIIVLGEIDDDIALVERAGRKIIG